MRASGVCAAALLAVAICTSAAQAGLVGVVISPPILVTWNIQVDYAAGVGPTGTLTAVGAFDPMMFQALQDYSPDGVSSTSYAGYFFLEAEIDKATKTAVGGMVSVSSDQNMDFFLDGDLDFSGGDLNYSPPGLFGPEMGERAFSTDLLIFGFDPTGVFDFRFANATGDLSNNGGLSLILGAGGLMDDLSSPLFGEPTFLVNFHNNGLGKADIPEPATICFVALGGLGALRRRRASCPI